MGYSYAPKSGGEGVRGFSAKRGKQLAIAAILVFFTGIFYFVGSTMTGYATYSKSLETQLNNTQDELTAVQEQKEICESVLENMRSSLGSLNSSLSTCGTDLASNRLSLDNCNKERASLESERNNLSTSFNSCRTENENSIQSYKQLARSSVRPICCSFGDVQSAAIRNWNIANNSIVCTGNYTINCTSGESNY